MFDFLIQLYSSKKRNKILGVFHIYFIKRKISIILFKILTIVLTFRKVLSINKVNRESDIIISLTTFPARISTLWLTIYSLFRQTLMPKKIILWLSSLQFPNGLEDIPKNLKKFMKYGLEIYFVDEDIGSHKKYYYTLQFFPRYYIVTVDDDFVYHSSMLEQLYTTSKNFRDSVVCNYARYIKRDDTGKLCPYNTWPIINNNDFKPIIHPDIFFGSGGGTLFPPGALYDDCLRKDLLIKLTPKADDIWLNSMCRLQGSHIVYLNSKYDLFPLKIRNNIKLSDINLDNNYNDNQLDNINKYYNNIFS